MRTLNEIKNIYELVELINNSFNYPLEIVEAAIEANGWQDLSDSEYDVCSDGKNKITLDKNTGIAKVVDDTGASLYVDQDGVNYSYGRVSWNTRYLDCAINGAKQVYRVYGLDVLKELDKLGAFGNADVNAVLDEDTGMAKVIDPLTYDVVFNDDNNSNNKGIHGTKDECMRWIESNRHDSSTYFGDYKGGTVSIVCDQTEETIYEEKLTKDYENNI